MKKILAFVLSLAMVTSFSVPAFAVENTSSQNEKRITDNSIDMIASSAFSEVFGIESNSRGATNESTIDEISYSYTFALQENDPTLANVSLTFTMAIGTQAYPVTVSGAVDSYLLSSGDTLWEGLITGTTIIEGTEYKVLAGFSKLNSSPSIQVSVTIQAADKTNAIDPLVFTFGDEVITMQIHQELAGNTAEVSMESLSKEFDEAASIRSAGSFTSLGNDYEYFDSGFNISGYAQRSRGYFNSTTNQFAVTLKSYGDNIEDYFSSTGIAGATIKEFTIELIRNSNYSDGSFSYIVGTESYDFDVGDYGGGAVLIQPLFEDIMGLLGVPTSTITAIFDGLKGSVDENFHTSDTSVSISFGLLQSADFDDSGVGVPIVFQLARNQNGYTGNSSYTFATAITYRTVYIPTGSSTPAYVYIDGYDTSKTVSITLG
ncbi:MAG: hypothetical protein IJX67_11350 [Oscillospiraceae bacterium]|nr:hypothetical protein [Oscillospiraceae bacterium]